MAIKAKNSISITHPDGGTNGTIEFELAENQGATTLISDFTIVDEEGAIDTSMEITRVKLRGADRSSFYLDPDDKLRFDGDMLNFEDNPDDYSLLLEFRIRLADGAIVRHRYDVTITVADVDEMPTDIALTPLAGLGTVDAEGNTFSVPETIKGDGKALKLADIVITDPDKKAAFADNTPYFYMEGATNPDILDNAHPLYELIEGANGWELWLRADANIDYESPTTAAELKAVIRVADGKDAVSGLEFVYAPTIINQAEFIDPTTQAEIDEKTGYAFSVAENVSGRHIIGTVEINAPAGYSEADYWVEDDHRNLFAIDPVMVAGRFQANLVLLNGAKLDVDDTPNGDKKIYTFKIFVEIVEPTDSNAPYQFINLAGNDVEEFGAQQISVTVNVEDANDEAPVFDVGIPDIVVYENTDVTEILHTFEATPDVSGDTVTYSLGGADFDLLNIDAATGELRLNESADYESGKTSYSFTVIATVGDGIDPPPAVSDVITLEVRDIEHELRSFSIDGAQNKIYTNSRVGAYQSRYDTGLTYTVDKDANVVVEYEARNNHTGLIDDRFEFDNGRIYIKQGSIFNFSQDVAVLGRNVPSDVSYTFSAKDTLNDLTLKDSEMITFTDTRLVVVVNEIVEDYSVSAGQTASTLFSYVGQINRSSTNFALSSAPFSRDFTYSLYGTNADKFNIDSETGTITWRDDFNPEGSWSAWMTVRANNASSTQLGDAILKINDIVLTNDEFNINSGEQVTNPPLDADSDTIYILSIITRPAHGALIINEYVGRRGWQSNDTYTYTANDDVPDGTTDSFVLNLRDRHGLEEETTFTVTIYNNASPAPQQSPSASAPPQLPPEEEAYSSMSDTPPDVL